jgi:hypothetical protein
MSLRALCPGASGRSCLRKRIWDHARHEFWMAAKPKSELVRVDTLET